MSVSPTNSANQKEDQLPFLGKTQAIPKVLGQNTTTDMPSHNDNKWITNSSLPLHIQCQSTIVKPLLKLSLVRILQQATVQTKKETCLGTLASQLPFQGKMTEDEPLSAF